MITITAQATEQILKAAQQAGLKEKCLRPAARFVGFVRRHAR